MYRRTLVLTFVGLLATPAIASFTSTPTPPSMPISSGAISAPPAANAVGSCNGTLQAKVVVTWTITPSTYATGYTILRKIAGVFVQVGTVSGRNTLTFTNTGLAVLTTYEFVVRATYQNWVSVNSPTASATTPALCL